MRVLCPKCASPVRQRPGRGRPRVFCSTVCRQVAAYEIKRLQRRLELRESRRLTLRHMEGYGREIKDGLFRTWAEQLAAVEAEIAEDEARLRVLLSEPRGTPIARKGE